MTHWRISVIHRALKLEATLISQADARVRRCERTQPQCCPKLWQCLLARLAFALVLHWKALNIHVFSHKLLIMRTPEADPVVGFFVLGVWIPKFVRNHRLFSNPSADSVKRHCT